MASTYEKIATATLSSATNSVTFSSIPDTYTDLVVVFNGGLNVYDFIYTQVGNGSIDTGSNYSGTLLTGGSNRHSNETYFQTLGWAVGILNNANGILHFMNYANTTIHKTILNRTSTADYGNSVYAGLWRSASGINIIKFTGVNSRTINAGSTFTIYGIAKA